MIELYVAITLLGIGYLMNNNKQVLDKSPAPSAPKRRELSSGNNAYDSTRYEQARKQEFDRVNASFQKSLEKNPSVINRSYRSLLSGQTMDATDFTHTNMVPWFSKKTVPIKDNMNHRVLEGYGAVYNPDTMLFRKQETKPLFEPVKDMGRDASAFDIERERMQKPIVQNNALPFTQIRVGPGLNQGYGCQPTGGFQQVDLNDYAMPKDTDELRVATKPKVTYEGRVVDGQKGSNRGQIGRMEKNRVETFYENDVDRYLTTTGAFLKDKARPFVDAKYTNRTDTTAETYNGPAYKKIAFETRSKVRDTLRSQLAGFDVSAPSLAKTGTTTADDYGKASIAVYANSRDITTTKTRVGNFTSLVKALVAPLEDIVKTSKKEYTVDAERQYGNMSAQIPTKATVRDPNDVARTTIKETTIHDSDLLNFKGATRVVVYDPNHVARTTIKETTVHDSDMLNFKGGALKSVVYDPSAVARTTIKETNLHDADRLNIRQTKFATSVYDPNDIAKTTIKETLIHDADITNIKGLGVPRGIVYDKKEVAPKPTVRQTLDLVDTTINMANVKKAATVYDPDDKARTTHKETLVGAQRDGNIDALSRFNGGYENEEYDAKPTQKEFYSDNDYYGGAKQDIGEGYTVANVEAKTTQKEFLSDNDYYGVAAEQGAQKQMSYEDAYNACMNDMREGTLVRREPTQTSVKLTSGSEAVMMQSKKIECDNVNERHSQNADRVINEISHVIPESLTRQRQEYEVDDRLDIDLLKAFKENPYTKPLDSFA